MITREYEVRLVSLVVQQIVELEIFRNLAPQGFGKKCAQYAAISFRTSGGCKLHLPQPAGSQQAGQERRRGPFVTVNLRVIRTQRIYNNDNDIFLLERLSRRIRCPMLR